jgi:EmrB/QacA subfamily drug resistance transporter
MPVTLSIISNVFAPRERARAIGIWTGAVGLAVAIGPPLGGYLIEHFWWGSVFLINVPIILAGLIAVTILVPESRDPSPGRVDAVGVVLSIVGLIALTYGIVDGGEHGFDQPAVWAWIGTGAAVLAGFIAWEARTDHPSLDVKLFRDPLFSASVGGIGLVFFAALGTFFFVGFFLQLVRGYSALQTGLLFTPFAAAQLLFAPISPNMVRRFGIKAVSATGMAVAALSFGAVAFWQMSTPVWVIIACNFLWGAGMASVMPPAVATIMATLPREKAGVGSAISNTVRQVSAALGVAVLGSLVASVYRAQVSDATSALPAQAGAAARESIAGAYAVAERVTAAGGDAGATLIAAADGAFITAMHYAAVGSAVVGLLGAVVSLVWMPARAPAGPPAPAGATPPDGLDSTKVLVEA